MIVFSEFLFSIILFTKYSKKNQYYKLSYCLFCNSYKSIMRLNITNIRYADFGEYHCIAKNELGITQAEFHLMEHSPYIIHRPGSLGEAQEYGKQPPKVESYEEICGPPTSCPECPDPRFENKTHFDRVL